MLTFRQPSVQPLLPIEYTHAFGNEASEHSSCTEALAHPHTKLLQHSLCSKGLDNLQTAANTNHLEHTSCTKGLEHSSLLTPQLWSIPPLSTLAPLPSTLKHHTHHLTYALTLQSCCTRMQSTCHGNLQYLISARHLNSKPRTPINLHVLQKELVLHPDQAFVHTLIRNLEHGCDIGYTGPQFTHSSSNLPSSFQNPSILDANITEECNMGRMLGPFQTPPLPNFRCSGLGLVPKHDGGWRAIYHLSAPYGSSINDSINPEDYALSYCSVDDAFAIVSALGKGTIMAKIDLKNAFRLVPVRLEPSRNPMARPILY